MGWVIARVWLPKREGRFVPAHESASNRGNVGHVSIQTADFYASFWPDWEIAKKSSDIRGAFLGTAAGILIDSPEIDKALEANASVVRGDNGNLTIIGNERLEPDVQVVLHTLNTAKMLENFREFCSSKAAGNWSIMGTNVIGKILSFNQNHGQSCSGLAYSLLNAGGIQSMVLWDTVSSRWTVAPDAVARVVVTAAESKQETTASTRHPLPPQIYERIKKPNYPLNPHASSIGYSLAEPCGLKINKGW